MPPLPSTESSNIFCPKQYVKQAESLYFLSFKKQNTVAFPYPNKYSNSGFLYKISLQPHKQTGYLFVGPLSSSYLQWGLWALMVLAISLPELQQQLLQNWFDSHNFFILPCPAISAFCLGFFHYVFAMAYVESQENFVLNGGIVWCSAKLIFAKSVFYRGFPPCRPLKWQEKITYIN